MADDADTTQRAALSAQLIAEAAQRQVISFDPGAALQKRIFDDGYVPNSPEFDIENKGVRYRAQQAEHLQTGERRVYYAASGDWSNVHFVSRNTARA